MSDFSWNRDEMIAHGVHLENLADNMTALGTNPGVGDSSIYGKIAGDKIHEGLHNMAEALYAGVDALNKVIRVRRDLVGTTAALYSKNEETNRQLAHDLVTKMGVDK